MMKKVNFLCTPPKHLHMYKGQQREYPYQEQLNQRDNALILGLLERVLCPWNSGVPGASVPVGVLSPQMHVAWGAPTCWTLMQFDRHSHLQHEPSMQSWEAPKVPGTITRRSQGDRVIRGGLSHSVRTTPPPWPSSFTEMPVHPGASLSYPTRSDSSNSIDVSHGGTHNDTFSIPNKTRNHNFSWSMCAKLVFAWRPSFVFLLFQGKGLQRHGGW